MLAPWRVAATVGATAGGIAAGTYAVKQLMTKQSENEASKGRAALSAMGLGIDGSVLDEDAEEPFTVVGDWKRLIRSSPCPGGAISRSFFHLSLPPWSGGTGACSSST